MSTLLGNIGASEKARLEADRKARDDALERWRVVAVDGWLAAYQVGRIPLDVMLRGVLASTAVLPDDIGWAVPGGRERLLGHVVRRALEEPAVPRDSKGGRPPWPDTFKNAARELVALVAEREGLVVSREPAGGGVSVFERVAEVYRAAGVRGVKAETVRDWYGKT